MSKEQLEIRKGGKLIETRWVYDQEADVGEYREYDVTGKAVSLLFENCDLASDVALKDIFLLLNTELDIFDTVIGNWCKEIVTQGLTEPEKPYDLSTHDPEQIEYLELKYQPEYDLHEGKNVLYGINHLDFSGIGVEIKDEGSSLGKKGERTSWSVCMTPANELINIPVRLGNKFSIYEGVMKWDQSKGLYDMKLAEFDNPSYSLGQILYSVIWELSFHGSPKATKEVAEHLKTIVTGTNS